MLLHLPSVIPLLRETGIRPGVRELCARRFRRRGYIFTPTPFASTKDSLSPVWPPKLDAISLYSRCNSCCCLDIFNNEVTLLDVVF